MAHIQNINIQEENDLTKIYNLISRNFILFILCVVAALCIAFFLNRYSVPVYSVTSSILIKSGNNQPGGRSTTENDFLFSNIFGGNQNFQNELWILRSYPIVEKTVKNLDLSVTYYEKGNFNYYEAYKDVPFKVSILSDHPQPDGIMISIRFIDNDNFVLLAKSRKATFRNFDNNIKSHQKKKWSLNRKGKIGELIETPDLAFIIESVNTDSINTERRFGFKFRTIPSLSSMVERSLEFSMVDRQATVIKINLRTESMAKGVDILNELMNVYSDQNLERKNHLATITVDYIEKQLSEISDSLSIAENNLQQFRSSRQLLNIADQTTGISEQYMDLQNQLAEMVSRKRYFDYVSDLLDQNNFTNMMLPASIGISDQLLNSLMTEFLAAQAQRSNLIANNQERNPLVQNLTIKIDNLKKTISENISAFSSTTSISIDELTKRIRKVEAEINRLPATQRQLGTIERKYRLNDAIYNYLMEKHAEAKITKASNLPDDIIIEPAKVRGLISPKKNLNYMIAVFLGFIIPFGFVWIKSALNIRIESQDDIEQLTDIPVLGKILHKRYKTNNIMHEFPRSEIAESIRALRTNLDFYVRGGQKKVILVTSCFENEGKSFIALNLALSYAQLGRKTILLDFDFRKPKIFFNESEKSNEGLSSYMIDKVELKDIILKSPNNRLDYIIAGILPPNPVELIALEKNDKLITELKNYYDIIVLDTTPLAQVVDAYLLMEFAEIKVLVTRYGQTLKKVFSTVVKDLIQKKVNNICIVLNDNRVYSDQYGYGYGYYNKKKFSLGKWKKRKPIVNKNQSN